MFILLGACTQIAIPVYISQIINNIETNHLKSEIYTGFLILVFISIIDYIANVGVRLSSVFLARNVIESIRNDVFTKLHQQEMEYYSSESVGQLLARTMDDVYYLQDVLSWAWRIVGGIIAISTGMIIYMFYKGPILAFVFALTYPLMLLVLYKITSKNARIFYDARFKFGNLADTMAENLSGIMTVKAFGREQQQIESFQKEERRLH